MGRRVRPGVVVREPVAMVRCCFKGWTYVHLASETCTICKGQR